MEKDRTQFNPIQFIYDGKYTTNKIKYKEPNRMNDSFYFPIILPLQFALRRKTLILYKFNYL